MRWPEIVDDNANARIVTVSVTDVYAVEHVLTLTHHTADLLRSELCDHFGMDTECQSEKAS